MAARGRAWSDLAPLVRTLFPTSAPPPGPRLRRGRSQARAPMARKPRLLAPVERGFFQLLHGRDAVIAQVRSMCLLT
ncbi:hypothetical protein XabCFBP2524_16155 [Xanthomonas axonopodis pv. begoniae]|nr:hypothetical protein XabCFBP2524_16155 [Xanthomonas axonopodis pv. begoniae]